jgi:hypothetical protein
MAALTLCALLSAVPCAHADTVLVFKYTPAPRTQIAIWLEDASGHFLATVALTEATAFRGIGNRPGASEMNSGYRWPYGRREGVLPVWAHRRASAPGARLFPRVVFQSRVEGLASRTAQDQSADKYFCLQFDEKKSSRDNLDAVSCATPFSSDKGRYLTTADVAAMYAEPWEESAGSTGVRQVLPLQSYYPPRMDITRCMMEGVCFDHTDIDHYADDARAVMPEIDAITIATPPGDVAQSILFSVPASWASGEYTAFIEVNLEGDYNDSWNATKYPTPKTPSTDWDYYALNYGYAYRGQPSLVWKVPFTLGGSEPIDQSAALPTGRSSWSHWSEHFGDVEPVSMEKSDPNGVSADVANSGVSRLRADTAGQRFSVQSKSLSGTTKPSEPPHTQPDAGATQAGAGAPPSAAGHAPPSPMDAGTAASSDAATAPEGMQESGGQTANDGNATPSSPNQATTPDDKTAPDDSNDDGDASDAPIGSVTDMSLRLDPNPLRAHTWVRLRMRAVRSDLPLHAYEVRVASVPITDDASFIRDGRQAKNATNSAEGATLLSLPTEVEAGSWIEAGIGDLVEATHYWVGVRATDELNRHGPITVAQVTTLKRQFQTVTPCFIATAAYGSPLANEVGVLRKLRDRYLMPQWIGRSWVAAYYRTGSQAAAWIQPHPRLRAAVRVLLSPIVSLAQRLTAR